MDFNEFAHAVAVDVRRRLPGVTFPLDPPGRNIRLGGATASISLDRTHWFVRFVREGSSLTMPPLSGSDFTPIVASNVAQSIAVFLEP